MTNERCDLVRDLAAGFVLGALTPVEDALVREHLASCKEPHDEFAELGGVVGYLAETVELVEPPAALKDRIMAAAAADLAAGRVPAKPAAPASVTSFPTAGERAERVERAERAEPARPARRRASPLTWVAGLAAVLAIVALGAWNVTLQRDLASARDYQGGLSAVLDVAAQPGSQTAILSGEGGTGPTGLAAVGPDGRVALVMRDLAPTTGTEVYEAWVIGGDGTPRPIGGFSVGPGGTATFTAPGGPPEPGVTLALTREPGPGATTPTLPIVSLGKATAPSS